MPKGTKVHKLADILKQKGMEVGPAIATAQKQTGQSFATGKKLPAKGKKKKKSKGAKR